MYDFSCTLADVVKNKRKQLGFTQTKLASLIGVDTRTIINIENRSGNPKLEVLYPLLRVLNIDPWEIFYSDLPLESEAMRKAQSLFKHCTEDEINALLPICESVLSVLRSKNTIEIK
jgi:transcriptional regulator with XRE-family HTH domain